MESRLSSEQYSILLANRLRDCAVDIGLNPYGIGAIMGVFKRHEEEFITLEQFGWEEGMRVATHGGFIRQRLRALRHRKFDPLQVGIKLAIRNLETAMPAYRALFEQDLDLYEGEIRDQLEYFVNEMFPLEDNKK